MRTAFAAALLSLAGHVAFAQPSPGLRSPPSAFHFICSNMNLREKPAEN
jgi:hypothetical protein